MPSTPRTSLSRDDQAPDQGSSVLSAPTLAQINRAELTNELHARSVLPVSGDAQVHHYAFAGHRQEVERYLEQVLTAQQT